MQVKVIRSHRRIRTVAARLLKDILLVSVPAALPETRLERIIADFKIRFERKRIKEELKLNESLADIAARLNNKYFGNTLKINAIEYVANQKSKFGCCNYKTAIIRISQRIASMPQWVRDYVILHEMAHLIEPNHGKAFWDVVKRYKLAERARGYLMAAGMKGLES